MTCAFGMEACKHNYTIKYIRFLELLAELDIARGVDKSKKTISYYKNTVF